MKKAAAAAGEPGRQRAASGSAAGKKQAKARGAETSAAIPKLSISPGADTLRFGNRVVAVTNLQKVLYHSTGFTKADVIGYYLAVSDAILAHLKGRAVTLKRYPNGPDGMSFYEKNCPAHRPPWVQTAAVGKAPGRGGKARDTDDGPAYCLLDSKASLAWVAQLASLELHTSLAKAARPDQPTVVAFDLDPGPGVNIAECARIALRMRDVLARLDLLSFPKTSGGKGLHFYVPLNNPAYDFEDTKEFANALARLFEAEEPSRITSEMRKDLRPGKVFIDWSQNDRHKTTVCAYSLRARERPTVSTPLTWNEVESAARSRDETALVFEAGDVIRRIAEQGDLFAPVLMLRQRLPKV